VARRTRLVGAACDLRERWADAQTPLQGLCLPGQHGLSRLADAVSDPRVGSEAQLDELSLVLLQLIKS
jgi:hypothetical protein